MGFVFLIVVAVMVVISLMDPKSKNNPKGLAIDSAMFKTHPAFTVGAIVVVVILTVLYTAFW